MKIFGKPLRLLILDVDGVLVDSISRVFCIFEEVAEQCDLPGRFIRTYCDDCRKGRYRSHSRIRDAVRTLWPELDKRDVSRFVSMMNKKEKEWPYEPFTGVTELLPWLLDNNVSLAICTRNSYSALVHRLETAKIDRRWFCVMQVPGKYTKPDPRAVHEILKRTGISRQYAAYVGDWYPDFDAARGARVPFIGTTSGVLCKEAFLQIGLPRNQIVDNLPEISSKISL